jgi:N-acetylglucosamine-6-phosphate deacetylase
VKITTFAPEVPGNDKIIDALRDKNAVMSLGHSTASPDQVRSFADRGVTHMTHIFNGMKGIHHRDPGPPLAGLLDDRISVELICDGFHVHPEIVRLIHRMKPPEKRILITDTVFIQLPGAKPGKPDEPNVLSNGILAGSRLRLSRGVKNYMDFTSCPLHEAVAMASLNPASLLGIEQDLGSIAPGKIADLWIAGHDLEPQAVFIAGKKMNIS